jgi:Na+/melibiose symporter-like transporter
MQEERAVEPALPNANNVKRRRRAQIAASVLFLIFFVLDILGLFAVPLDLSTLYSDVFMIVAAVLCPALAIIFLTSLLNNWTLEREDRAVRRAFRYAIIAVIVISLVLFVWQHFLWFTP